MLINSILSELSLDYSSKITSYPSCLLSNWPHIIVRWRLIKSIRAPDDGRLFKPVRNQPITTVWRARFSHSKKIINCSHRLFSLSSNIRDGHFSIAAETIGFSQNYLAHKLHWSVRTQLSCSPQKWRPLPSSFRYQQCCRCLFRRHMPFNNVPWLVIGWLIPDH